MPSRTLLALVLAATMVLAGCASGPATQTTAPTNETTTATTAADAAATTTTTAADAAATTTTAADAATTTESTTTESTTTEPTESTTTTGDYPEVKTENCQYRGEDDDEIVSESGACLPFDADTVYRRVLEMTGQDLESGGTIVGVPARETRRYNFNFNNATFGATMGIEPNGTPNVFVPGFAVPNRGADGSVSPRVTMRYVGLWNDSALREELGINYTAEGAEVTAAHEFLHVVQFYRGSQQRLARNLTTEGANARDLRIAVIEGSASFFETEYQREYMNRPDAERNRSRWRNDSAYAMKVLGPYVLGEHYTRWYLNGSTEDFEKLYDEPPVSMEQVIHKYEPDEELPKNLTVRGRVSSDWSRPSAPETKGELFVRAALRSELNGSAAARGAAGWGQDGVVTFQNASFTPDGVYKYGYAWAIRFDNASEAAEFQALFEQWLESKGTQENGVYVADDGDTYRLVEVTNETVVVLAGHERFTTQATVSGNTSRVVIEHTTEDQTQDEPDDDEEATVVAPRRPHPLR